MEKPMRLFKTKKVLGLYILLLLGFLEMTLRIGSISLFRLGIPLIFIWILYPNWRLFKKEILFLGILGLYNVLIYLLFGGDIQLVIRFYIHSLAVFSIVVIVKYLKHKDGKFERHLFKLLDGFTLITLVLFVFQYLFRFNLPGTVVGRVNTFYWTENEMGMSLAVMACLYCQRFIFKRSILDLFKLLIIVVILYINDNRISMIGLLFFVLCASLLSIKGHSKKAVIGIAFIILLIFMINPILPFKGSQVGLRSLILEPVIRIITLEPYRLAGSLPDRTDAIIYNLMELKENFFVGIGLGNSLEVLQRPEYKLVSAQSMHNIVAQYFVELGYFAIITYILIFNKVILGWWRESQDKNRIFKCAFTLSFILISMQSSSGIFSNYFMVTAVSYFYLAKHNFHSADLINITE